MTRYHPLLVAIHWVVGILILLALLFGNILLEATPNSDPEKLSGLMDHMRVGLIIAGLMVIRLIARLTTEKPPHADTGNALLNLGGRIAHWVLYLLVFGMIGSGLAMAFNHDLFSIVFGNSGAPLPPEFVQEGPRMVHGLLSKLLMLFIALHIAAWLFHQFVLKDGLFSRMWFGRRH